MKKILFAAITLTTATFVNAATFEGPYVQIGAGAANNLTNYDWAAYGGGSLSDTNFSSQLLIGYSKSFDRFNIGANVFRNFGDSSSGNWINGGQDYDPAWTVHSKVKNVWGISLEPGYYFSEDSLGYLKLGWASGDTEFSDTYGRGGLLYTDGTFSKKTNGVLYGFGLKQSIGSNLFLGAELSKIDFNKKSLDDNSFTQKPTQTQALVTLGYNFSDNKHDTVSQFQAGLLNGPYLQFGAGLVNNTSKSYLDQDAGYGGNVGKSLGGGQIAIGYSQNINNFNIAGNIHFNIGAEDAGTTNITATYGNYPINAKIKNNWGIAFEPGLYLSESSLCFLKLGLEFADIRYHDSYNATPPYSNTISKSSTGFSYGVGFKQLLTSNVYIGAEISRTEFDAKHYSVLESPSYAYYNASLDTALTMGLVTLGYKF